MPDFPKTLEVALKLFPDTKHIVVVGGVGAYDRANAATIRDSLRYYEARFDVTYLTDLDMPTLLERLKRLPRHSIILQAGISEDAAGTRYIIPTQSNPLVAQAANAPVFSFGAWAGVDVGQGEVGGYMMSTSKIGQIVADDVVKILNGEKPKDIPVVRGANVYMFDWHALRRWGLSEVNVPSGSLLLNRQPSFWEVYGRYVVLGVLVFLAQLVVIALLLWQRRLAREAKTQLVSAFGHLHESEERFRSAMNNVASGLFTLDRDGMVTYVNPATEAMFGWKNVELLGKKLHDVKHYKHPDGTPFPASECPTLQIPKTGIELREYEDTFIRKDGSFFPVVYSASPLTRDGATVGIVVGFRDDTLRREAERAIRENEERFRLIANTAPVLIWMSDADNRCTFINQGWLEFTGRSTEEELTTFWADGIHPDDVKRAQATYAAAVHRRESFRQEYRLRRHDGEYRWILDSGVPPFSPDRSFAGYIGLAIDITDQKLAHETLSNLSQTLMQAHEQERAFIARELHDDLAQRATALALQLQTLNWVLPGGMNDRVLVQKLCEQAVDLAHAIPALSHRLHSAGLEHLGLVKAAAGLCKELSDRHTVKIHFTHDGIPEDLPKDIALCPFRVLQEAMNNALKHSGSQELLVSLKGGESEINLVVDDLGIGLDPEKAINGGGLGLTSMRERLKLVGGDLSIDSMADRGTTIHARVPLSLKTSSVGTAG
jgi:PAS domain S-box-containing protein